MPALPLHSVAVCVHIGHSKRITVCILGIRNIGHSKFDIQILVKLHSVAVCVVSGDLGPRLFRTGDFGRLSVISDGDFGRCAVKSDGDFGRCVVNTDAAVNLDGDFGRLT